MPGFPFDLFLFGVVEYGMPRYGIPASTTCTTHCPNYTRTKWFWQCNCLFSDIDDVSPICDAETAGPASVRYGPPDSLMLQGPANDLRPSL